MKGVLAIWEKKAFGGFLLAGVLVLGGLPSPLSAEYSPALREDSEIERQKLLRASDQLELLVAKVEQIQAETTSLRQKVEILEAENKKLSEQAAILEKQRAKEKQALLEEVSKLVAKGGGSPGSAVAAAPAAAGNQEGYEHKVQHGETLWSILQAYREATGTKATLDDVCAASNINKTAPLRSGQMLFIPKK
jgi:chromosome segregation ATPase